MFDKCTNSNKQGDLGLGVAIGWFTSNGYTIAIPLTDSQDYDLIVDNGKLSKVQVKTTTLKAPSGNYCVDLRVNGGNRSGTGKSKNFDPDKVDMLFVLTESNTKYLLPSSHIGVSCKLTLCDRCQKFLVE